MNSINIPCWSSPFALWFDNLSGISIWIVVIFVCRCKVDLPFFPSVDTRPASLSSSAIQKKTAKGRKGSHVIFLWTMRTSKPEHWTYSLKERKLISLHSLETETMLFLKREFIGCIFNTWDFHATQLIVQFSLMLLGGFKGHCVMHIAGKTMRFLRIGKRL